ncbi:MAG: hypothetical protein GY714_05155 [Desulfobacterales bacterium]|nr:hypothetical protein [Desulfobacterales bacterium]
MPYYAECYILVENRDQSLIRKLLELYLGEDIVETSEIYEIPMYSDEPKFEFKSSNELMDYMEINTCEEQNINWFDRNKSIHAGVHYTNDNAMILHVSCESETDEDIILEQLKKQFNTSFGYIAYEQPPPYSSYEFKEIVTKLKR